VTFGYAILASNIFKTASVISNEKDARFYEPFLNRMYNDAKNNDQTSLYQWWVAFWSIICSKFHNVAVDHIEQFFEYTFTFKEIGILGILLVSSFIIMRIICIIEF
jgi:hypothetical protein